MLSFLLNNKEILFYPNYLNLNIYLWFIKFKWRCKQCILITLQLFIYLYLSKSSAVACRHGLFLKCQWIGWQCQLALKSSCWGKQVKNLPIFTADFVKHKNTFLSWQYPNIGLIKLGGGGGGLGSGYCYSLSNLNSGLVLKGVPGVGTCNIWRTTSIQLGNRFQTFYYLLSFLGLGRPPSFQGRLSSFK